MKKKALHPLPYITKDVPIFLPSVIDLSVVLTINNKAEYLPDILDPIWETLRQQKYGGNPLSWEIVIVNNGSTDDLCSALKTLLLSRDPKYSQRITLVDKTNLWDEVAALRLGMGYARGSYIVSCIYPPSQIVLDTLPKLISPLLPVSGSDGADAVTISEITYPKLPNFLKKYMKRSLGIDIIHYPYPLFLVTRRAAQNMASGRIGGKGMTGMMSGLWKLRSDGFIIKHFELDKGDEQDPIVLTKWQMLSACIETMVISFLDKTYIHPLPSSPVLPSKIVGYGR